MIFHSFTFKINFYLLRFYVHIMKFFLSLPVLESYTHEQIINIIIMKYQYQCLFPLIPFVHMQFTYKNKKKVDYNHYLAKISHLFFSCQNFFVYLCMRKTMFELNWIGFWWLNWDEMCGKFLTGSVYVLGPQKTFTVTTPFNVRLKTNLLQFKCVTIKYFLRTSIVTLISYITYNNNLNIKQ